MVDITITSDPVEKHCRGNRYCSFTGPFYSEHLVVLGGGRSHFVGRCYSCGAYVCNRCAHRQPPERHLGDASMDAWVLHCPFDGDLLGRGDHWLVLDEKGNILQRSSGLPAIQTLDESKLVASRSTEYFESRGQAAGLLERGVELLEEGEFDQVLEVCDRAFELVPNHPIAWLLRRDCLEKMGRYEDAWSALRTLLYLNQELISAIFAEGQFFHKDKVDNFKGYYQELELLLSRRRIELPEHDYFERFPDLAEASLHSIENNAEQTIACLLRMRTDETAREILDTALIDHWIALEYAKLDRYDDSTKFLNTALTEVRASKNYVEEYAILVSELVILVKARKETEAAELIEQLALGVALSGNSELAWPALFGKVQLCVLRQEVEQALSVLDQMDQQLRDPIGRMVTALCRSAILRQQNPADTTAIPSKVLEGLNSFLPELTALVSNPEIYSGLRVENLLHNYAIGFMHGRLMKRLGRGEPSKPRITPFMAGAWAQWKQEDAPIGTGSVHENGVSPPVLLTATTARDLAKLLSELPPQDWDEKHWIEFLKRCETQAGIKFSGGWKTFADQTFELKNKYQLLRSPLSSQMVVELRDEIMAHSDVDLGGLYALYAEQCVARSPRISKYLKSDEEVLILGELLAGECFQREQRAVVVDSLASLVQQYFSKRGTIEKSAAAISEYGEKCPLYLLDSSRRLSFCHSSFEEYFLARHLWRSLFHSEKPNFKLVGSRHITQASAEFLNRLIADEPASVNLLLQWLAMKRQRRSLFLGADIPIFVRNLALIYLLAKRQARGFDLAHADFSGLDLGWRDFSHANLTAADFRSANLAEAKFYDAILIGANFEGANLKGTMFARAYTVFSDLAIG